MDAADAGALVLMYGVFPLWVAIGLADWACHRASGIERTSGLRENLVHWLLFGEIGLGLLAVVLLELNGAVLAFAAAVFLAHELTVYLELRYTVARREVRPIEQMVHSFMEILPLVALAVLAVMAWERIGEFGIAFRREPVPPGYLVGAGAASLLLNVLPLAEETWRCATRRTPPPPAPR
jgi:hypothetical protein